VARVTSRKHAARQRKKTVRANHPVTMRSQASKVREKFSDVLNRVAYRRDRVVLERHGRAVAALVPVEDLELLEELEDRLDLEDARAALEEAKNEGTRPWEKIKAALGL
jgi:prevent-host-death family protein